MTQLFNTSARAIKWLALMLVLCACSVAWANTFTVTALRLDGNAVEQATDVLVRLGAAGTAQRQTLTRGQVMPAGTELTAPRGLQIELTTINGNRITLYPGARFLAAVLTEQGESHVPLGGRVLVEVRRALIFFNLTYDRITAGVKGTTFEVGIEPAKSLELRVTEGVVEVERQIKVSIESGGLRLPTETDNIFVAEDVKAGESRLYSFDASQFLERYGTYAEAEAYFRKALKDAELSNDPKRIHRAVHNLMEILRQLGKYTASLDLQAACVQSARATGNKTDEAVCWQDVGIANFELGRFDEAVAANENALLLWRDTFKGDDHHIASILNNLATSYTKKGNTEHGARLLAEAAQMFDRLRLGRPTMSAALVLDNIGGEFIRRGDLRKAVEYIQRSVNMAEAVLHGRDHPSLVLGYHNLGVVVYELGQPKRAIPLLERALSMSQRLYGASDHPRTAVFMSDLANAYAQAGDLRLALSMQLGALRMIQKIYSAQDQGEVAKVLNDLAVIYDDLGDSTRANDYFHASLAMKRRILGATDDDAIAMTLYNLGYISSRKGDHTSAIQFYEEALSMRRRLYGENAHIKIAAVLGNLGLEYGVLGDLVRSEKYLLESLAMKRRVFGEFHQSIADTLYNLGNLSGKKKDHPSAIQFYEEVVAMRRKIYGGDTHIDIAVALEKLGIEFGTLGDFQRALSAHARVLEIRDRLIPGDSKDTVNAMTNLAIDLERTGRRPEALKLRERARSMQERLRRRTE